MKPKTKAYLRRSYEDFKKRPLLVTLFCIAIIAAPIMFLERMTSPDTRYAIDILKEYFADTFLKEPIQSIFLFIFIYPVAEELLFRGPVRLLDYLLTKSRLHIYLQVTVLAIAITTQAYLWASRHISQIGFLIIGVILGVLVVKSQRLWMAVAVHIAINVMMFVGMSASYWLF